MQPKALVFMQEFDILAISLNILYNYFDNSTKLFIDLY